MFFKNYQYFLAIVENGGVTRAAETLYLSQPSLSKYLSRLEQNLGIELFDHTTSPLKLTFAGQRYYEYIQRIQALDRQFEDELTSIRRDESGSIRVGIAPWRGSILLPILIPAFHAIYPRVEIDILEGRAIQTETALVQGKVDLCLMNLPSHFPSQTIQELIWNEHILLVGNRDHPVIRRKLEETPVGSSGYPNIDIRFLENEEFISLKEGQNVAEVTKQLFAAQNLAPKKVWTTENMSTAINMVAKTMCFTMMPEVGTKGSLLPDNLAFFTVGSPEQLIPFAAIYRSDFVLNNHIHVLLDLTRKIFSGFSTESETDRMSGAV